MAEVWCGTQKVIGLDRQGVKNSQGGRGLGRIYVPHFWQPYISRQELLYLCPYVCTARDQRTTSHIPPSPTARYVHHVVGASNWCLLLKNHRYPPADHEQLLPLIWPDFKHVRQTTCCFLNDQGWLHCVPTYWLCPGQHPAVTCLNSALPPCIRNDLLMLMRCWLIKLVLSTTSSLQWCCLLCICSVRHKSHSSQKWQVMRSIGLCILKSCDPHAIQYVTLVYMKLWCPWKKASLSCLIMQKVTSHSY